MNTVLLIGGPLDGAEAPLDDFRDGHYLADVENRPVVYSWDGQYLAALPKQAPQVAQQRTIPVSMND